MSEINPWINLTPWVPPATAPVATSSPNAHVHYWAISLFNSRTFWVNAAACIVAVLSATEVITVIPLAWLPVTTALVALLNIYLRTITVRPVAIIAPGTTTPVTVARVGPPAPATIAD